MFHRFLQLVVITLSTSIAAQTVPPAPVQVLPVQAPAAASIQLQFDAAKCNQAANSCGLSDCSCWWQLWRASCSSTTNCPAASTGSGTPYVDNLSSMSLQSNADNGRGGWHYNFIDTDTAIKAGTTWIYFMTVNFASYTPYTISPPSNTSGAIAIAGGSTPVVPWKIYLNYTNTSCVTGNTCTSDVYRATCTNATNCPTFNNGAAPYTLINATTTQTVTASSTTFQSIDDGTTQALASNVVYNYVVRNRFAANPSNPGLTTQIVITTPSGVHSAILNWSNPACKTSSPCSIQVYRATCSSTTSCPAYAAGSSAWKALNMSSGLVPTVGSQGTSWQYTDNDTALVGSTTFSWVATNSYNGATTASAASAAFVGTTSVGKKETK